MKKVFPGIIISITAVFIVFIVGLFVGRQQTESQQIPEYIPVIITEPTDPVSKININTASASELSELPGIGYVLATRIVNYREEHGPYKTISDITSVEGIGNKRFEAIMELICV